jgi:ribosomal protein S12 methylthiotransferase
MQTVETGVRGSYYIKTLGCPKNTADSETIEARLLDAGLVPARRSSEASVVVVNTCGFIESAKEESINELLRYSGRKVAGQKVIGAGCLTGRYGDEISLEIPELDAVVGVEAWDHIASIALDAEGHALPAWMPHRLQNTRSSAYIKISDGCSAPCTFCSIPKFKGLWRSKPADQVIAEARDLVAAGVRELVLVSQDSSAYGYDLGQRDALAPLLEQLLEAVPDVHWIRVMYVYPGHVTRRLIDVMQRDPRIARYIDIPLQHAHPEVLKRMRRPPASVTRRTLETLREAMPDVALRTAFIVGSPGETEEEFEYLLRFMEEFQFDRAGVFTYSQEEGTPMAAMADQVPARIKRQRLARAMKLQAKISLKRQQALVGQTLDVLVEGLAEGDGGKRRGLAMAGEAPGIDFAGRSYRDAPEVDGLVFGRGPARVGDIVRVRVTQALEHDLVAEVIAAETK